SGNAAGGGPVCRLPERYRTPVDRVLTEWIGRAVEGTVRAAIEVFDRAGAATPDRHEGTEGGGNGRGDDPGGTFTARPVSITHLDEPNLVSAALTMVGDQGLLANDEFGLIDHGGNRFTVVLPGVTDLTVPEPGWNPVHRTVRDLDRVAIDSARVNGIGYNRYARMVAEGLAINGVDEGAELLLIRHSFGADTALDLAADPAFTERYRLVQVVATGYNSEPQLAPVAPGVEVLVVRNRHDLVVAAETLLPSDQTGVLGCDQPPGRANGSVTAGIGAATIITFDGGWVGPSPGPGPDLEPGSGPRLVGDLGHGIARYRRVFTDHAGLSAAGAASIGAVVADLEARGFVSNRSAAPPIVTAIDVSVPHP
ncbi:MAG: hypothetical protein OER95_15740, partial [Acidimicrobiia bacterium]|nr:hypothetical protein [Acidimicrobiia bacterium]